MTSSEEGPSGTLQCQLLEVCVRDRLVVRGGIWLVEIQFQCFQDVGSGLGFGGAVAGHVNVEALGDETVTFAVDHDLQAAVDGLSQTHEDRLPAPAGGVRGINTSPSFAPAPDANLATSAR
jgi:hypothetical protein